MKRKEKLQELKEFLLKNFIDELGDLDISGLDFSDFDGAVDISHMKIKGDLWQIGHQVKGDLYQDRQVVSGDLQQDDHLVLGDLFQGEQRVSGKIFQNKIK